MSDSKCPICLKRLICVVRAFCPARPPTSRYFTSNILTSRYPTPNSSTSKSSTSKCLMSRCLGVNHLSHPKKRTYFPYPLDTRTNRTYRTGHTPHTYPNRTSRTCPTYPLSQDISEDFRDILPICTKSDMVILQLPLLMTVLSLLPTYPLCPFCPIQPGLSLADNSDIPVFCVSVLSLGVPVLPRCRKCPFSNSDILGVSSFFDRPCCPGLSVFLPLLSYFVRML
jgi:hypothetical protein